MAGLTKGKSNRHNKLKAKYTAAFGRTLANKARRAARRKAQLAKRAQEWRRIKLAEAWAHRHPCDFSRPCAVARRYGVNVFVNVRHPERPETAARRITHAE